MSRLAPRPIALAVALGSVTGSFFATRPALAVDPRAEAAAVSAIKKAAGEFLAMDFASAEARLKRAARACGASRCAASTKAAVLRDLGAMQFRAGDPAAAAKSFADAIAVQPDIKLNPDYEAPDLRKAWDEATGGPAAAPAPEGDFDHTPPAEQKANTPLPIFAGYDGESVVRVIVKYKGTKMTDWRRLNLTRIKGGWGGLIPCDAVTLGALEYYLQGFDGSGDPAASSGDPKRPFVVPIKDEIVGEEPHLPGQSAPSGCESGAGEGSANEEAPPRRRADAAETEAPYAAWWLGISGAVDFVSLPAASDVCKLLPTVKPANSAGYYCTTPYGDDYPSRTSGAQNAALVPGQSGAVTGGVHPGDVRVMLAIDYAVSSSILVGVRIGGVGNAYSGSAAAKDGRAFASRVHIEARGTYLFGRDPLAQLGFAPMVFAATGASEFDGHTTTLTLQQGITGPNPVNAWITSGPLFLAFGGGMRYQFSRRAAFTAAVRVNVAFGGVGVLPTYGPELAFQYGF